MEDTEKIGVASIIQAWEQHDRLGNADHSKSKSRSLFASLHRWWKCSVLRLVAVEFYNFPLRIRAILREPYLRRGWRLPLSPWGHNLETFPVVSSFLYACSEDIQELLKEHRWCGYLEAQMAAQAFQRGARWGLSNHDKEKRSEGA